MQIVNKTQNRSFSAFIVLLISHTEFSCTKSMECGLCPKKITVKYLYPANNHTYS